MTGPARLRRRLGVVPLAAVVFFNVSGGPYGAEDTVSSLGPGLALLLLAVTPLVWSLPVALAMSELAGAMPDEGGYVTWTTRAFGPFWGFQVGWWSWIDSFVDVAAYPALFVEYLRYWHPVASPLERWALALLFVAVLTAVNVLGVRPTGAAAVALAAGALAPLALLVAVAGAASRHAPWTPFTAGGTPVTASMGLGLAVVIWNYSGWDTPTTCLGETRAPERAFRLAALGALPVIVVAYLLPLGASLGAGAVPWTEWRTGSLPTVASAVGGQWLGHLVAVGAVVSTAGLFAALLLTNSRLPFVLARGGALPRAFAGLSQRFGTPWLAVCFSGAVYAALSAFTFRELVVLNVWLYSLSLIVELAAFLALRARAPAMARPWRVPGGRAGALAVTVPPVLLALLAMVSAGPTNMAVGVAAALTGPLAWRAFRSRAIPA